MKYVAKTDRRFDVIIVDSTDPHGPGKVLFSQKFYAACRRCMKPGGVMVTQNGVPILQAGRAHVRHRQVSQAVRRRLLLRRGDPDLCRRPHGHGLGDRQQGAAADAASRPSPTRYKKAGRFQTRYWTPEVHVAAFALPRFIAEMVDRAK